MSQTDYAKQQEAKHKRKIILPSVISWEYGSNKFASQKGQAAFGTIRNTKLNNDSDVEFWTKNDKVIYVYEKQEDKSDEKPEDEDAISQEKPKSHDSSVPKFESQHSSNDDDEKYKAWIGGQTTTFMPSTSR